MGWFDEQIRTRVRNDDENFSASFARMANVLSGGQKLAFLYTSNRELTEQAIQDILEFYGIHAPDVPDEIEDVNEVLDFVLRPSGIMRREVLLTKGWYKDATGPMMGSTKDGRAVAFLPGRVSGYVYTDPDTGKRMRVNRKTEALFDSDAMCFYKPFPLRKLKIVDLFAYTFSLLQTKDYVAVIGSTVLALLVGMAITRMTRNLYGEVLESGSFALLFAMLTTMLMTSLGRMMVEMIKSIVNQSIQTRLNLSVESATMMRTLSMPPSFFKQYSAGELSARIQNMNSLCSTIMNSVLSVGLTAVFSLAYLGQVFKYAAPLVVPSLVFTLLSLVVTIAITFMQMKITEETMKESSKESGMVFGLINGVSKLKVAGAEKRAFAKWADQYAKVASRKYNPPAIIKFNGVIGAAITMTGTVVMYYTTLANHIQMADYQAFNAAYGQVSGAFSAIAGIAMTVATIRPILEMVKPLLEEAPETAENKHVVTRVSGGIELSNVSFRYKESMPYVLDNISLKISPGQYVAIVGKTGCGKSTLMRILLGFEHPEKGAVYYDGKDLDSLDVKSLRRKIGVVMQNGKLFQGDIYSNIVISAPWLTLNEAWEAAEMAGMREDIENMPMGMNTLISEGSGGISGGQRQRLMIARAIAPKPKILMFDEATSALDNVTQKIVSDSLDSLNCTRLVIAHRLSTIRHCDRIIVLEKGKIIEDGTYGELIAQGGFFAELVERQRIDVET